MDCRAANFRSPVPGPRRPEQGFALLFVFLMAASIAILFYMSLPRMAFESQRQKEELLIERGEQYKRAIQLFVRTNKRYPANMDELEKLNNRRYLRHRYIDPMTGKDEWRIIHVGPGGVLTDSILNKGKKDDKEKSASDPNMYISERAAIGETLSPAGQSAANPALRRRPSDMPGVAGQQPGALPGVDPVTGAPLQQGAAVIPGGVAQPGIAMQPGGVVQPGQPGVAQPGMLPVPGVPGVPQPNMGGQVSQAGMPVQPIQPAIPGVPGQTFVPNGAQPGMPTAVQPGMPGAPQSPGAPSAAQNQAISMIGQLLTTPRQFPGQAANSGIQQMGAGIAGVASTAEGESIMLYNDRQKYKEWEFVYDFSKDTSQTNQPNATGTPVNQMSGPQGQQPSPFFSQSPQQPQQPQQ